MKKNTIFILGGIAGVFAGVGISRIFRKKPEDIKKCKELADNRYTLMKLFNRWMILKEEGRTLEEYFARNDIRSIAIYGMSDVGERLYYELKDSSVTVEYAIDRNAEMIYAEVDVLTLEDKLPKVDAVVVTAVFYFDGIKKDLEAKMDVPILSLEDILYEL